MKAPKNAGRLTWLRAGRIAGLKEAAKLARTVAPNKFDGGLKAAQLIDQRAKALESK